MPEDAAAPNPGAAAPAAAPLQAPARSRRSAAGAFLLGPLTAVAAAAALQQVPERIVEVHVQLDLRAAVLLVACLAAVGAAWAALAAPPAEEKAAAASASAAPAEAEAEAATAAAPRGPGLDPEALQLPDELLRVLLAWRPADRKELECPVCHDPMLRARRTSCQHHACAACLERLHAEGVRACPRCGGDADLQAPSPAAPEVAESLGARLCSCTACRAWEGPWADFGAHLVRCPAAQGVVALRSYRLGAEAEERRRRSAAAAAVDALYADMSGASPALVHRVPAHVFESPGVHWSAPPFSACGRPWSIRIGPLSGAASASGSRYFCLLPHAHDDRLRCSLFFAKRGGEGFKERRVHDWPPELAGHPWGPTVQAEELAQYKQADGSLLLMVHAEGLGSEATSGVPG